MNFQIVSLLLSLSFLACSDESDQYSPVEPEPEVQSEDPTPSGPDPVSVDECQPGDVLGPGEKCSYPGTGDIFTVLEDGSGQFLLFTFGSGGSFNIEIGEIKFVAVGQGDGTWRITMVGKESDDE